MVANYRIAAAAACRHAQEKKDSQPIASIFIMVANYRIAASAGMHFCAGPSLSSAACREQELLYRLELPV